MLAMKDVIQMTLKSIQDSLFRLTYILDPAFFASDEIDKVVEPAGIYLGDNVGGTRGSAQSGPRCHLVSWPFCCPRSLFYC